MTSKTQRSSFDNTPLKQKSSEELDVSVISNRSELINAQT